MNTTRRLIPIFVFLSTFACDAAVELDDQGVDEDYPTETEPLLPGTVVRYELAEQIIPATTEIVLCHFLETTEEELFVTAFEAHQGKFGHHLIIFKAGAREAPGTIRDCTSPEDMVRFRPVISSVQFGLEQFPEGMAIRVPRGSQIVLQQHYVNTSQRDIRVKDIGFMHTVKKEDVRILAGFFGLSDIFLDLPPKKQTSLDFDCPVPIDMNLLLVGPHMHEYGTRFQASLIQPEGTHNIIDVAWNAGYRDSPPVANFDLDAPLKVRQGDVIRTICTFDNTTDKPLTFPKEMCATYGYFFPAPDENSEFLCAGTPAT